MRKVGIREVRQNLSDLIHEVSKGREIVITSRGREVARLVPPRRKKGKPFPDMAWFRRTMPVLDPPLSQTIIEEREEERG